MEKCDKLYALEFYSDDTLWAMEEYSDLEALYNGLAKALMQETFDETDKIEICLLERTYDENSILCYEDNYTTIRQIYIKDINKLEDLTD